MKSEFPERRIVRGSGLVISIRILSSRRTIICPDSVDLSFTTTVTLVRSRSAERLRKFPAEASSCLSAVSRVQRAGTWGGAARARLTPSKFMSKKLAPKENAHKSIVGKTKRELTHLGDKVSFASSVCKRQAPTLRHEIRNTATHRHQPRYR